MMNLEELKKTPQVSESDNFCLEIVSPGLLDTLTFKSASRQKPGLGEVEIEVGATGLNFKEVLIALGVLPVPPNTSVKFGLECAGKIVAKGEGVSELEIGDEVIAFAPSCFSAFTTVSASSVAPKPNGMSLEEAATIPIAFMTAYYALIELGRLGQNEKVLIHAAAGGVGMAAVQIAQMIGADIFATAGNAEKRDFLRSLGIEKIMDSRSLSFADELMKFTGGRGVDVVLNSLAGEFIPKSLSILAPFGRFLEIGKRDIYENSQLNLQLFEKGISFFVINLGTESPNFNSMLREVVKNFQDGNLTPLPLKIFPIPEVATAFEYMARAKHIGKIVVSLQDKEEVRGLIASSSTRKHPKPVDFGLVQRDLQNKKLLSSDHNLGLLPTEGIEVFDRILGSGLPQVLVSTQDLLSRLEQSSMSTFLSSLEETEHKYLPKQVHPRPQLSNAYVAPRNELERQIAQRWEKLLGIEHVGIYDDFFDLGGDSLLAVQLIAALKENIQMELSVNNLLDHPTIAGFLESIALTSASEKPPTALPSYLVKIQAGNNNKQPFFLAHPIGGQVYFYRDLVSCMESERPVYGFQSLDLDEKDEKTELLTNVEKMAAEYIKAMRFIQQNGPYFIGGASFGGMIAFEMAQQLHAEGEKVAVLAMIDTPGPGEMGLKLENETAIATYIIESLLELDKNFISLNSMPEQGNAEEQVIYALEQAKIANLVPNDFQIQTTRNIIRIFKANMEAMWNYRPRIYPGKIIFFRAQDRREKYDPEHPEYSWMDLAASGIEIYPVGGNHITMNYDPHVQVIAEKIKLYLEQNN
ncbi:MAG: zinc-binding dehydrogenase [Moorea sp. SIO4G3]|nr:zinc-binding dehydrogenase [Moorena sp. SIO4G3]